MIDGLHKRFELEKHTPNVGSSNPIFEREKRRLPWIKDNSSATDYRSTTRAVALAGTLVIWAIASVVTDYDSSFQDALLLLVISVAFITTIVADLYSGLVIANNLYRQLSPAHWELLRTSMQSEKDIFEALFSIAQLQAWRPTAIEEALRIVVIELILLRLFVPVGRGGTVAIDFIFSPLFYIRLATFGILVMLYIFEVRWRTRTFIGFSFFIVSYVKNVAFANLAQFGAILLVDLLQIASFVGFGYFVPIVITPYFIDLPDLACLALPLGAAIWCTLIYILYGTLGDHCLDRAFKWMFAPAE